MTTPIPIGPRLSRIGQISVNVKDIERATAFYRDILGMTFLFEAPPSMAFFDCDGVRLMLGVADRPDLEKEVDSNHHIALQAFAKYLRAEMGDGAKVLEEVAKAGPWMRSKARVGKVFLRIGTWLTNELEQNDQKRIGLAVDSVMTFLKRT